MTLKVGQGQQTSIRSKTVLVVFLNHYPCYRYRSNFEKLFEMAMQQYKLRTLPGAPAIKRPIHKQNREVGGRRRKARADSQKPKKNPQTKHKNYVLNTAVFCCCSETRKPLLFDWRVPAQKPKPSQSPRHMPAPVVKGLRCTVGYEITMWTQILGKQRKWGHCGTADVSVVQT